MRLITKLRRAPARSTALTLHVGASAPSTTGRVSGVLILPVPVEWSGSVLPAGGYVFSVSSATSRPWVDVLGVEEHVVFLPAAREPAPGAVRSEIGLRYDGRYHVRSLTLREAGTTLLFDEQRVAAPVAEAPLSTSDPLEARMNQSPSTRHVIRTALSLTIAAVLLLAGTGASRASTRAKPDAERPVAPPETARAVVPSPKPDLFTTETIHPPCHPNPRSRADMASVFNRGDIRFLPQPLQQQLVRLAGRPHSTLPIQAFAEADSPSRLFQYYLLDTHNFEPNVFTHIFPGVNDAVDLTATGADCGLPTIGAVRMVVEPKPDLPTDPNDVRAFIDVFTDIHPLFVINNESGWYEGWMIHDLRVATIAPPRPGGHAQFGRILQVDADALARMGAGNNVPGNLFTTDGLAVRFPSENDHFPGVHANLVPIYLSMGAYNALQQSDIHSYWEFNYTTNWVFPLYELPFTGGIAGTFEAGQIGALSSLIPGSGPAGFQNEAVKFGDNPFAPRDPDRFDGDDDSQRETRMRFIPSGLAHEIFLDVFERLASFEPGRTDFAGRLNDAYFQEVARVDQDRDGVISAVEGDVDSASDGFDDNARLFLPATSYDRFAVTREINDGYLAPRFANSQKAWVLTGFQTTVSPAVPASEGRDSDDR